MGFGAISPKRCTELLSKCRRQAIPIYSRFLISASEIRNLDIKLISLHQKDTSLLKEGIMKLQKNILKQFSLTLIILSLLLATCNSLPEKPKTIPKDDYTYLNQYLNSFIPAQMKDADIIGLGVNVISDKEVLFSKGFGFSNKAKGLKVTADTIFRVASVSKIVNLVITMKLVEEGKLNLDTDITKYLPELKLNSRFEKSKPITIRSILTHHSGIPSDRMKGFFSKGKTNSLEKLISDIDGEYVSYPPNKIFSYSNLGHSILGRIVEKVSNDIYSNVVTKKVFLPLGMDHSFYEINQNQNLDFSKGYGFGGTEIEEAKLRDLPAGFLNSSVNDLSKFIQMFLNDGKVGKLTFLKESTLEQMYQVQNGGNPYDDEFQIGLGFFLNTFDLGNEIFTLQHGGDTFLFHSMLGILPRQKLGVITLSNSITSASLVHQVAKKSLEISLETKFGHKKSYASTRDGFKIDMSSYAGVYQNGNLMEVEVEDGKVFSRLTTGARFILPNKENEWQLANIKLFGLFNLSQGNLLLKFKTIGDDKLLFMKVGGTVMIWGNKILPSKGKIPDVWETRVGKYKILNDDADNSGMLANPELKIENGFLVFQNNGLPAANIPFKQKMALQIINDKEAVIAGLGRGKGDTVSIRTVGGKELLTYSGYDMEKVK